MTDTIVRGQQLAYRDMVDESLWQRLVNRIMEDEGVEQELAEKIMNEALGFLRVCSEHRDQSFSPAPLVDIGWHTFILYTRPYADFCQRYAGEFIHHNPNDEIGKQAGTEAHAGLGSRGTLQFMIDHGYPVNVMLWMALDAADCTDGWGERCEARCDDGPRS